MGLVGPTYVCDGNISPELYDLATSGACRLQNDETCFVEATDVPIFFSSGNHHVATFRHELEAAAWAVGLKPSGRWNFLVDKALCPYFHGTLQSHVGI